MNSVTFKNIYVRTYCTCALIKRATYSFARYTDLFPDIRPYDVLNIVHVSIGGFVICVEQCSTMRCLAGTAPYLLICIMRAQLWRMGMIHVRVFKAFCTRN